jgi:SPP1 gp7 family putative phage head morphogenesis protein
MMSDFYTEKIKLTHRLQGLVNAIGDDITESMTRALEHVEGTIVTLAAKSEKTESLTRKKKYLEKQRGDIETVLHELYRDLGKEITEKSIETAIETPGIIKSMIVKSIPARIDMALGVPHITKERVLLWFESYQVEGLFFNQWLSKLEKGAVERIMKETQQSMILSEPVQETAKRVQNALSVGRKTAQGMVHNAIYGAHNWAERAFYLENEERLQGLRFVAELDRRTTPLCRTLDGQVFPVQEAPQPPLHWLCRSMLLPVFYNITVNGKEMSLDEYIFGDKNRRIARIDTRSRWINHRDGTRSKTYQDLRVQFPKSDVTYNDWLQSLATSTNREDVAFAREVLGPARFKLVSEGKLKMESLYYHGKLRTIEELKELMK